MSLATRSDRSHRVLELRATYRAAAPKLAVQAVPARSAILLGLILALLDDTSDERGAR